MFHHFHNAQHPVSQGSLGEEQFRRILEYLETRFNLLNAGDYFDRTMSGKIQKNDICLTFDDGLKCQLDIAVPVLDEFGLKAFFFVYSGPFEGLGDSVELYRYFRTTMFPSINDFYDEFSELAAAQVTNWSDRKKLFESSNYLSDFVFYTEADRWHRYLRDQCLGASKYKEIMMHMMRSRGFNRKELIKQLWINDKNLIFLTQSEHIVGLHSYSHPTKLSELSKNEQQLEYQKNHEHLKRTLGRPVEVMSHPCGEYTNDTLDILKSMGIKLGFRSNMSVTEIKSSLEIPREDHANILSKIRA